MTGEIQTLVLAVGTALLAGFDILLSHSRMKEFGNDVELNPVVRWVANQSNPTFAALSLGIMNAAEISIALFFPTLLAILFGAKLALAALQLKSIHLLRNS